MVNVIIATILSFLTLLPGRGGGATSIERGSE